MTTVCPTGATTIMIEVGLGTITLPPKCKASTDYAVLPRILSIKQKEFEVVSFAAVQPFNVTFSDKEHKIIGQFTKDPLYQDLLAFAGQSVPIDSLANELGSLRIIQQQRHRAGSLATVAGYTSLGLVILVVGVCLCVGYGWHLLRGGRSFMEAARSVSRQHPVAPGQAVGPEAEMEPLTVNL